MILNIEKPNDRRWVIFFIILLGFVLRICCIFHHLPLFPHIEESLVVKYTLQLNVSDFNYHDFIYPGLFYYLLFPLFGFINFFFSSPLLNPFGFDLFLVDILIGRILSVIFAVVNIFVLYTIGKRLLNLKTGLIAALFLAINPLHISQSFLLKPDMLMLLLISISFLFICKLYETKEPRQIDYIIVGLLIGLATAAKYNAILMIVPLLIVHFIKIQDKSYFINRNIVSALIFACLVFFLFNPFIILDFRHFLQDIMGEFNVAIKGFPKNPLANRRGWINYPLALNSILGSGIFILSLGGLFLSTYRHSKEDSIILSFPAAYYIFMGVFKNSPAHYLLPVIPFILLLAAQFLVIFITTINHTHIFRSIHQGIVVLLCIIFISTSLYSSIYYINWINQKDTRILARDWILNNIPAGAKILMDGTSENISFIFSRTEKHPYHIDIIKWTQDVDCRQFFGADNFDFIVIESDKKKPSNITPLYDFIENNFLLIKEFVPFINRPKSPLYISLYNPAIKIYISKQRRD